MKKTYIGYKVPRNLRYKNTEISYFDFIPELKDTKNYYYFFLNTINHNWIIPQLCNNPDKEDCNQIKRVFENKRYLKHQPITKEELNEELKTMVTMTIEMKRLSNEIPQRKTNLNNELKLDKLSKFTIKRERV